MIVNYNNDAFKDYRYNDENQFNPDPDAAVPTQTNREQNKKLLNRGRRS